MESLEPMLNNPKLKNYIYTLVGILVFIGLLLFVLQFIKNRRSTSDSILYPTPTAIEGKRTYRLTPSPIPPTGTGVYEEQLPKAEQDLADQKQALKFKLPVIEPTFNMTFDYGEDKFVVELKDPKDQAQQNFLTWLQANYPAITIDRFIFK